MKPFNLERALKRAKVCTRDGSLAKVYNKDIHTDYLEARVMFNGRWMWITYNLNGRTDDKIEHWYDLMMDE